MKKFFLTILTIVYMALSCGIAMEIHYCMGKKAGMELYGSESEKCGKCGMTEKETGCCHDEHKFVKLEDSHKNVYNNIDFSANEIAVTTTYSLFNWQIASTEVTTVVNNNSPPDYTGPSACIMNCVFRI